MLMPAAPPQAVSGVGGFDYVTVDARRRRMYAAHSGAKALLIVNSDSGKVLGQVPVGESHGVAVDPANGHVYVGTSARQVVEVDPVRMKAVRRVSVAGPVDAVAYDSAYRRIYADEDDGTHLYVIDAESFRLSKTVSLPGHKPEYLAVNPGTHEVYQNIADLHEIAVVDPVALSVTRTISTAELRNNHPLQFDPALDQIVTAGKNGVMSAYHPNGTKLGRTAVVEFDQCDLDASRHVLACFGGGTVTRFRLAHRRAPTTIDVHAADSDVHTGAIDAKTEAVFVVWGGSKHDFVQKLVPDR